MTMVRETAAPWYLKQAEFDGITIIINSERDCPHGMAHVPDYCVAWGALDTSEPCGDGGCSYFHLLDGGEDTYEGNSLEEAEAAYAELERKLLAGELR